jgi:hypothetical protein
MQRTTTFSDDLVKQGEAILLTFNKVRGEGFERTIKVAADLSTRLGGDLNGAIRQVGRALQDPIQGLTLLRRAGIQFSEEQQATVKSLLATNQAAKAQELILSELEKRFGGSAAAARNTLGGALTGLKNAFGDLFEGTREGTGSAVGAINGLAAALESPGLKSAIDGLITGLAKVIELAVKGTSAIAGLFTGGGKLDNVASVDKKIAEVEAEIASRTRGRQVGRGGFIKGEDENEPAKRVGRGRIAANVAALKEDLVALKSLRESLAETEKAAKDTSLALADMGGTIRPTIDEFTVALKKIELTPYEQLMEDMQELTKTSVERQVEDFNRIKVALDQLKSEGLISEDRRQLRLGEALDELLPEIDIEEIRGNYKRVEQQSSETSEIIKGIWQGAGQSIQRTFSDAFYEGKLSMASLVDVARRAFADIAAAILTSGIKKAMVSQFGGAGGSGGLAAGGGWEQWLKLIGIGTGWGGFGGAGATGSFASGGRFRGLNVVGEDGPELVAGSGQVFNRRQLAFAGGGAKVTYAPVTTLQVIEREDPRQMRAELLSEVAAMSAQQQQEFMRQLERNGVMVR